MRDLPAGYEGHIQLVRIPDAEGDENRGWRLDVLEIRLDGEPAGYAAPMYIPQERLEKHYPNGVWDYLRLIGGKVSLPDAPTDPSAEEALTRCRIYLPSPDRRLKDKKTDLLRRLEKKFGRDWYSFLEFNVDRPKMDYIRVYDGFDREYEIFDQGRKRPRVDRTRLTDFQGLGLGTLIYRETARWMAESGLLLHASMDREPGAAAAWQNLKRSLPEAVSPERRPHVLASYGARAEKEGQLLVLDGSKVPSWAPAWARSATIIREDGTEVDLLQDVSAPLRP